MSINFLFIILINLFTFICSQPKDYLNKYNQLYYSSKYKVKPNWKYVDNLDSFECTDPDVHCAGNGDCNDDQTDCDCNFGYASITGSFVKCTYTQKSKMTALLLEAFIGFGLGHLYCKNYMFFIGKFLFYFFSCYFIFCIMIFVGSINDSNVNKQTYLSTKRTTIIIMPIIVGWYLFDVAMFFMNKYVDNNGIALAE